MIYFHLFSGAMLVLGRAIQHSKSSSAALKDYDLLFCTD